MATGDIRNGYPAGAETAASSGAPAASAPSSSAPAALPARRNPIPAAAVTPAADRMRRMRRRQQWSRWAPFQLAPCAAMAGGSCPYHADPEDCPGYRLRAKRPSIRCVPVCYEERRALCDLADSMARAGLPSVAAMFLGGAFLRAGKGGDARLLDGCLKQVTALSVEAMRASARAAAAGKAEGEVGEYLGQLLAGAPGGAA